MNVSDWARRPYEDERSAHDILISIQGVLEALLTEVHRANSVERTGAVSSVELKFLANGTPQPVVKLYAGSAAPVDEAMEAYARTMIAAQQASDIGWAETLAQLQAAKAQKEAA